MLNTRCVSTLITPMELGPKRIVFLNPLAVEMKLPQI